MPGEMQKLPSSLLPLPSYPGSSFPGRIEVVLGVAVFVGGETCLATEGRTVRQGRRPRKVGRWAYWTRWLGPARKLPMGCDANGSGVWQIEPR